MDKKSLVKAGYEAIGATYTDRRTRESDDVKLLDDFVTRLSEGWLVLDAGCGGGVPIAQTLSLLAESSASILQAIRFALHGPESPSPISW